MKTHDFRIVVSAIRKKTGSEKIRKPAKAVRKNIEEEVCHFTVEPLSVCRMRKTIDGDTRCPFSLEACIRQDI